MARRKSAKQDPATAREPRARAVDHLPLILSGSLPSASARHAQEGRRRRPAGNAAVKPAEAAGRVEPPGRHAHARRPPAVQPDAPPRASRRPPQEARRSRSAAGIPRRTRPAGEPNGPPTGARKAGCRQRPGTGPAQPQAQAQVQAKSRSKARREKEKEREQRRRERERKAEREGHETRKEREAREAREAHEEERWARPPQTGEVVATVAERQVRRARHGHGDRAASPAEGRRRKGAAARPGPAANSIGARATAMPRPRGAVPPRRGARRQPAPRHPGRGRGAGAVKRAAVSHSGPDPANRPAVRVPARSWSRR